MTHFKTALGCLLDSRTLNEDIACLMAMYVYETVIKKMEDKGQVTYTTELHRIGQSQESDEATSKFSTCAGLEKICAKEESLHMFGRADE